MGLPVGTRIARDIALALFVTLFAINHSTASLGSALAFVSIVYFLTLHFSSVEPLSGPEVVEFFLSLSPQTLLTALGIFAAYLVAVETWRMQKRFEIKLAASVEIDRFMEIASNLSLTLDLYADSFLDLRERARTEPDWMVLLPAAQRLADKTAAALKARADLSTMAADVHILRSRHDAVLNSSLLGPPMMDRATSALSRITKAMYFPVPDVTLRPPVFLDAVLAIDPAPICTFQTVVEAERKWLNAAGGGVLGGLVGTLIKPTLWTAIRTRKVVTALARKDKTS